MAQAQAAGNDGIPLSVDFGGSDDEELPATNGPGHLTSSRADVALSVDKSPAEVLRPRRVDAALRAARNFEEFRQNRPFKFLHLYSGLKDPLGEALKLGANAIDRGR